MLMLLLGQARGGPAWSLQATRFHRAPFWWHRSYKSRTPETRPPALYIHDIANSRDISAKYSTVEIDRVHGETQSLTTAAQLRHGGRMCVRQGRSQTFSFGGPLEGPVMQQGELSMVCVGLSERDLKNFGGATGGAVAPLAPP